ncbi:DNA repair protein rad16, partial [Conglomerata obtusa]
MNKTKRKTTKKHKTKNNTKKLIIDDKQCQQEDATRHADSKIHQNNTCHIIERIQDGNILMQSKCDTIVLNEEKKENTIMTLERICSDVDGFSKRRRMNCKLSYIDVRAIRNDNIINDNTNETKSNIEVEQIICSDDVKTKIYKIHDNNNIKNDNVKYSNFLGEIIVETDTKSLINDVTTNINNKLIDHEQDCNHRRQIYNRHICKDETYAYNSKVKNLSNKPIKNKASDDNVNDLTNEQIVTYNIKFNEKEYMTKDDVCQNNVYANKNNKKGLDNFEENNKNTENYNNYKTKKIKITDTLKHDNEISNNINNKHKENDCHKDSNTNAFTNNCDKVFNTNAFENDCNKDLNTNALENDCNKDTNTNASESTNSESSENETIKKEPKLKVDIRTCLIKKDKSQQNVNFRNLTPLDYKKIKKQETDEHKILNIHKKLLDQEEVFRNALNTDFEIIKQPQQLVTLLMPYQLYGVSWMLSREKSIVKGGILADEMGMGKTLQALGLILCYEAVGITLIVTPVVAMNQWVQEMERHAPGAFEITMYHGRSKKDLMKNNTNVKDYNEYCNDFKNKFNASNNEISNGYINQSNEKMKHMILLTTYGTIESEYRKKDGILYNTAFRRVILDEAHYIKDSKSNTSTAILSLNTETRWGLTGTPVQNRVGDLYSLVRFLRLDPHSFYFCKKCDCKSLKWLNYDKADNKGNVNKVNNANANKVINNNNNISSSNVINDNSNKNDNNYDKTDNNNKDYKVINDNNHVSYNISNNNISNSNIPLDSNNNTGEYVRRGFCTCGHFSASHFSWWNRRITNPIKDFGYTIKGKEIFNNLNKITSHIILRRTKQDLEKELGLPSKIVIVIRNYFSEQEKEFYSSLYQKTQTKFMSYAIKGEINNNYAHIFELLQKMRLSVNHPYLAIKDANEGIPICGYCNEEANDPIISKCKHIFCREEARIFLSINNICPVCKIKITIDLNQEEDFTIKKTIIKPYKWTSSSKIECLVEELTKLKSKTSLTKSIVFSQFVNFLELLRWRLERAGFRCVHIYGSMPITHRKAAIEEFNNNKDITVFLISLKAGGVALNLTEANRVFLMDLWWNPAVEEQAMDRIHRIGQYRPIRINRIIIQDSIESRILALQEKKKALFDSAVDNDISALE